MHARTLQRTAIPTNEVDHGRVVPIFRSTSQLFYSCSPFPLPPTEPIPSTRHDRTVPHVLDLLSDMFIGGCAGHADYGERSRSLHLIQPASFTACYSHSMPSFPSPRKYSRLSAIRAFRSHACIEGSSYNTTVRIHHNHASHPFVSKLRTNPRSKPDREWRFIRHHATK